VKGRQPSARAFHSASALSASIRSEEFTALRNSQILVHETRQAAPYGLPGDSTVPRRPQPPNLDPRRHLSRKVEPSSTEAHSTKLRHNAHLTTTLPLTLTATLPHDQLSVRQQRNGGRSAPADLCPPHGPQLPVPSVYYRLRRQRRRLPRLDATLTLQVILQGG
jgi:hypothetical protein